jgi:hypothetical protein
MFTLDEAFGSPVVLPSPVVSWMSKWISPAVSGGREHPVAMQLQTRFSQRASLPQSMGTRGPLFGFNVHPVLACEKPSSGTHA